MAVAAVGGNDQVSFYLAVQRSILIKLYLEQALFFGTE